VRNPFTGQRGQGFYLLLCSAQKAYLKAVHRYNSGSDPMQYLDPYYCSVPRPG
jgi:hypothetical protein